MLWVKEKKFNLDLGILAGIKNYTHSHTSAIILAITVRKAGHINI